MAQNLLILTKLVEMYQNLGDAEMVRIAKARRNAFIATIAWGT